MAYLIIINFYDTYIFKNLSSETQQNKTIKHNREQPKIYGGVFFRKIAIVSDVFKVTGSAFQTLGAATEKARLPKLSFVLGTISCESDDRDI